MRQTDKRQKTRSRDGGDGFSEEVTFSLHCEVLGEEHFGQEIAWCVYGIRSRPAWQEHGGGLEELRVWWEGRPGALQARMKRLGFVPSAHRFLGTLSTVGKMDCRSTEVEAVGPEQGCTGLWWWTGLKWWRPRWRAEGSFRVYILRKLTGLADEWEVWWGRGWGKQGW